MKQWWIWVVLPVTPVPKNDKSTPYGVLFHFYVLPSLGHLQSRLKTTGTGTCLPGWIRFGNGNGQHDLGVGFTALRNSADPGLLDLLKGLG